jgi:NAD(P)-dependent dehydrogenase (short-subunit alcohol dehydrogenase family)
MRLNSLDRLDGKIALVTGASRGLGREIARALAARGAEVVVSARKLEGCQALVTEIEACGWAALAVAANIGHWEECDALVESVYAHRGRVDVLVNNAGMGLPHEGLGTITERLFDKTLAINLRGAFRVGTLVAERMAAGEGGSIVNIGSVSALHPSADTLPYSMAKAGVHTLSRGLAATFAPKVRANTIVPGPFFTDIAPYWDMDRFARESAPRVPLARAGEPGEIVGAAVFLASEMSSYVSGTEIRLDGGWPLSVAPYPSRA